MNSNLELRTSNLEPALKIDWHCHILPGIDDGSANMDESIAMARALCGMGFSTVYCTPHLIKGSFEADSNIVMKAFLELKAKLKVESIHLELLLGREYYMDEFLLDYLREPIPLGNTRYILVEIPSHMEPEYVKQICYRIKCSGYTPMIAHPERCRLFSLPLSSKSRFQKWFEVQRSRFKILSKTSNVEHRTPNSLLGYLTGVGCCFQGNLGSFAGCYGSAVCTNAVRLRDCCYYTCFGSDAHSKAWCSLFDKHLQSIAYVL